jgi:hypothetical protein
VADGGCADSCAPRVAPAGALQALAGVSGDVEMVEESCRVSVVSYARRDPEAMGKHRHYSEQEFEALVSSALDELPIEFQKRWST